MLHYTFNKVITKGAIAEFPCSVRKTYYEYICCMFIQYGYLYMPLRVSQNTYLYSLSACMRWSLQSVSSLTCALILSARRSASSHDWSGARPQRPRRRAAFLSTATGDIRPTNTLYFTFIGKYRYVPKFCQLSFVHLFNFCPYRYVQNYCKWWCYIWHNVL